MVESVSDPGPEGVHPEESSFLSQSVQLRISIEQSGRDELIEDANGKWWEDREDDVVEGQDPRFVDGLTGEGVLEGVLQLLAKLALWLMSHLPRTAS